MIVLQLPKEVKNIISKLEQNGHEAYAVGGCVRDCILGKTPKDWDITTSAKPEEIKSLFKKTVDTGIQHGTVTVIDNHNGYEVTTYRLDGKYSDGRHPESVEFTPDLKEDLKRRDFTINAMAYNDINGLVDEFCGQEDLEKGIIRCVGDPTKRFEEDADSSLGSTPIQPRVTCPSFTMPSSTWRAVDTGMANPIPMLPPERE